jgi:alkaline phosphatase D
MTKLNWGIGSFLAIVLLLLAGCAEPPPPPDGPYQATGFKICEVDQDSAIVWARLTRDSERVNEPAPMPIVTYRNQAGEVIEPRGRQRDAIPTVEYPDGASVETIEGAVPGAEGEVRVRYRVAGEQDWRQTAWHSVDPDSDFTSQIKLGNLEPAVTYEVEVLGRRTGQEAVSSSLTGRFQTAAPPDVPQRVLFTVSTGQRYPHKDRPDGFKIYDEILRLEPSFFVHTGDILYYDDLAKNEALARWHWQRMYSLPTNVNFHRQVSSYFIKDDHDTLVNDSWPSMQTTYMGELTFQKGLEIFREQVGMGEKTYRTVRWGKDLQVWMVEGRDFRSANDMPDGPEKTIWGVEQMDWFRRTVEESDATFRILISPTPVVGPDRESKHDNHSNKDFTYEGSRLRSFLGGQKNMYVVCGDRHWQYVSEDKATGVREYSCGPASDEHAGGWTNDQRYPEHQYLNVIGGFLAVTVEREGEGPVATFRHYSVDGKVLNEDRREAQ